MVANAAQSDIHASPYMGRNVGKKGENVHVLQHPAYSEAKSRSGQGQVEAIHLIWKATGTLKEHLTWANVAVW